MNRQGSDLPFYATTTTHQELLKSLDLEQKAKGLLLDHISVLHRERIREAPTLIPSLYNHLY